MQSPIIVFDHINQTVTIVPQVVPADSPAAKALADQRTQVTSANGSPAR